MSGLQVDALAAGIARGHEVGNGAPAAARVAKTAASAPVAAKSGNRKPRSAASREAARKRMVAWWAAKTAAKKGK